MEHLHHLEAPFLMLGLSWLALAITGLYLWWEERRKRK